MNALNEALSFSFSRFCHASKLSNHNFWAVKTGIIAMFVYEWRWEREREIEKEGEAERGRQSRRAIGGNGGEEGTTVYAKLKQERKRAMLWRVKAKRLRCLPMHKRLSTTAYSGAPCQCTGQVCGLNQGHFIGASDYVSVCQSARVNNPFRISFLRFFFFLPLYARAWLFVYAVRAKRMYYTICICARVPNVFRMMCVS